MNEELKVIISAETEKLRKELDKANKEVEKLKKDGESNFKTFNEAMNTVGTTANKVMKTASLAIAGATTALLALGASTKEYRQGQAMLTTAFETAGASAETAKNTYNDLYRVLGDDGQAVEAANHLAKLTNNQKELKEWTTICQGVYATFGASLPIEGLTEAANETAKVGTVTGSLADALNWAGVSEDAFNESLAACNTEAEREALIRETLSGLYSGTAATYEKNAGSIIKQNEAQIKLNDSTAKLGEAVAPVNEALTELANDVLAELTPYIQSFVDEYGQSIADILGNIAEGIGIVMGFIADNWEIIITIASVILGIVAAINAYNAAMTIYNLVTMPVNATILAISVAIGALVAIISVCIIYWDEIAKAASIAWDWIKNAWNVAAEWFNNYIVKPIAGFFSGLWGIITGGASAAWNGIRTAFSVATNWFNNTIVKPVGNFFKGMWDGFLSGGKAAWNGVKSVFSAVAGFFKSIFTAAWNGVKAVFSTGGKIFDGIKDGIVTAFKAVVNVIIKGINTIVALPFNGLNGILNTIHDISILGVEPFSWLTWRAPVPQIPLLAKGGIVNSATLAMIGEQGQEAVMPLENNTEWIDKLAAKLSAGMGGSNQPIVMQVDGKTFAEISVNSINNLTRLRGSLPLVVR